MFRQGGGFSNRQDEKTSDATGKKQAGRSERREPRRSQPDERSGSCEQGLAGDAGRRAENLVAKREGSLRPPSRAPEAGRSARSLASPLR